MPVILTGYGAEHCMMGTYGAHMLSWIFSGFKDNIARLKDIKTQLTFAAKETEMFSSVMARAIKDHGFSSDKAEKIMVSFVESFLYPGIHGTSQL